MIKQLRSQNCFRYFHYGTVLEYYCSTNPETHCLHSFLTDSPTKRSNLLYYETAKTVVVVIVCIIIIKVIRIIYSKKFVPGSHRYTSA